MNAIFFFFLPIEILPEIIDYGNKMPIFGFSKSSFMNTFLSAAKCGIKHSSSIARWFCKKWKYENRLTMSFKRRQKYFFEEVKRINALALFFVNKILHWLEYRL